MSHDGEMAAIPLAPDMNPPDIKTKTKEFLFLRTYIFVEEEKY